MKDEKYNDLWFAVAFTNVSLCPCVRESLCVSSESGVCGHFLDVSISYIKH